MATEATITEVTDNLDDFAKELFGTGGTDEGKPADKTQPTGDGVEQRADGEEEGADDADSDADAGDPDASDEEKPDEIEKRKRSTAERVKSAVARQRQAEREAAHERTLREQLEARIAALEAGAKSDLTPGKADDNTPAVQGPDPTKYRYGELDPQYLSDLADYRAELKVNALLAKQKQEQEAAQQAEAARRQSDAIRAKAEEVTQAGQAKFSDFEEVVVEGAKNGDYPLTQEMFEIAAETEVAADILYHFATNPDEAFKVSQMNPRQQALWFGRMEAKLTAPKTPEPKRATGAPPPPASIPKGSGGKGGVSIYDLEDPRALDAMTRAMFGKG